MKTMNIMQKHNRVQELGWAIMEEEYECEKDSSRSRKHLADLKQERLMLNNDLNKFYEDPMTQYAGF